MPFQKIRVMKNLSIAILLFVLLSAAIICLCSEADSIGVFVVSKAIGFASAYAFWRVLVRVGALNGVEE